jgi:hypothetical protein
MNNELLIYAVSPMMFLWGIARFFYSKTMVSGYNDSSREGNLILNMDLAAEGIGISILGILSLLMTILVGSDKLGSIIIYILSGATLVFLSIWSAFSITKDSTAVSKLCPLVKIILSSFYFWAALM